MTRPTTTTSRSRRFTAPGRSSRASRLRAVAEGRHGDHSPGRRRGGRFTHLDQTSMPSRRSTSGFPVDIDGYEILDEIGAGGFSMVYRARQTSMNRDVAIKVLNTGFTTEAERRTFERECHALGRLSHHPEHRHGVQRRVHRRRAAVHRDGAVPLELSRTARADRARWPSTRRSPSPCASAARCRPPTTPACCTATSSRTTSSCPPYGEPALGDFGISTIDDERSQSGAERAVGRLRRAGGARGRGRVGRVGRVLDGQSRSTS